MDRGRLVADLEASEGFRRQAYKDTRGFWTAGYGHLLIPQETDWQGRIFARDEIEQWLNEDIDKALAAAQKLDEWPSLDTDARQNAVVELVFNMGCHKWQVFTRTRLFIARKTWQYAHDALLDSLWAKQVGQTRSNRIANYVLSGVFSGQSKQAA